MEADIASLKTRVETMERRGAEADEQMARLRQIMDEATALLARNNADVGARVQKNEMDLGAIAGRIEEAKHLLEQLQQQQADALTRLTALEQGQQQIAEHVAPSMAENPDELWRQAQEKAASGSREDARRFYRAFIQRYPQDSRSAQAHIEIGRSYAQEGKHTPAVAEYNRVLERFGKSRQVPEAFWRMAESYIELRFCSEAKALLQNLLRRYPRSPHASEARGRMRELERMIRQKGACNS